MIILNDINKTVIDESKVVAYYGYEEEKTYCISIVLSIKLFVDYNSQEARDKDIELLDKLFDVKNIEDYVYGRYPDETQTIKKASEHVKEDDENLEEDDENYVHWGDVCQLGSVEVELPSSAVAKCTWFSKQNRIGISYFVNDYDAFIYDENLFNALMLKKVE